MTYLLDTDWLIDYLHGRADAVELIDGLLPAGLALSTITYAEYYEGVVLSPRVAEHLESLESFLSGVALLPVDRAVARVFGEQRARLRARGRLIDNFDLLIAATALRFSLTLVTRNARDFQRIEGLAIYAL